MKTASHQSRLIVAAAAFFEARDVLEALAAHSRPVTFIEVGIGAIKSAQIAARTTALINNRPVLFIGSCGTSDEFRGPELISARSVTWAPADVRHGESYLIPFAEPEVALDPLTRSGLLNECIISCSASITSRKDPQSGIYENLELYGVASAWKCRTSNFRSILGVTNLLGPDAHLQWKANHKEVGRLTAVFVAEHLDLFT